MIRSTVLVVAAVGVVALPALHLLLGAITRTQQTAEPGCTDPYQEGTMTTTPDTESPTAHAGDRVRVSAVVGMYGRQLHADSWPFVTGDVVLIFCPDGTVRWEASA